MSGVHFKYKTPLQSTKMLDGTLACTRHRLSQEQSSASSPGATCVGQPEVCSMMHLPALPTTLSVPGTYNYTVGTKCQLCACRTTAGVWSPVFKWTEGTCECHQQNGAVLIPPKPTDSLTWSPLNTDEGTVEGKRAGSYRRPKSRYKQTWSNVRKTPF